jgi:AcrR family transcriptional regulator
MQKGESAIPQDLVMTGTKWELFNAAVDLFSTRGYTNVGIRDIADAIGIKSASIYNHFETKDAFLDQIYKFYDYHYFANILSLEDALDLVGKIPAREVISKILDPTYEKGIKKLLEKVPLIVIEERDRDPRAEVLAIKVFIDDPNRRLSAVLKKMMKLGLIEPIDADAFASVVAGFGLYAVSRVISSRAMSVHEWYAGHEFLLSTIKEKQKN